MTIPHYNHRTVTHRAKLMHEEAKRLGRNPTVQETERLLGVPDLSAWGYVQALEREQAQPPQPVEPAPLPVEMDWPDVPTVAGRLNMRTSKLHALIDSGKIHVVRAGRRIYVDPAEIERIPTIRPGRASVDRGERATSQSPGGAK